MAPVSPAASGAVDCSALGPSPRVPSAALEGGGTGQAVPPGSSDALLPTADRPLPPDRPTDAPGGSSRWLPPCDNSDDGPCIFPLDCLLMREPSSEASDPPYQGPGLPEDRRLRSLRGSRKVGEWYRYLSEAHVRLKTQLDYWSARDEHSRLSAELDRYRAMLAPTRLFQSRR